MSRRASKRKGVQVKREDEQCVDKTSQEAEEEHLFVLVASKILQLATLNVFLLLYIV
jgi:hypothetical protein